MKFLVFGLVVTGLLIAALLGHRRAQHEPVFKGQPLSRWIWDLGFAWRELNRPGYKGDANDIDFLRSTEGDAKLALCSLGEQALPYLTRDLHEHDSQFVNLYYAFYMRLPFEVSDLLPFPKLPARKRLSAAIALQDIGPASAAAIPDLGRLLTDDDAEVRIAAQETLRTIRAE